MALEIFDGIPGSGKSYNAMALRILPHLARGGTVVTNVEVVPDGVGRFIKERYGKVWNPSRLRVITEEQCPQFFQHTPKGTKDCPVLVVLDEIHLWFNARDWQKNDTGLRQTFELATQHRKFNLDIVLISQHLSNIDGQFLKLIAGLSRFRDLSKTYLLGIPFLRIPFFRFLACHYDKNGRTLLKRDWLRFDPLIGDSYKTEAVLKGGKAMGEAEVVEREELEADPVVKAKFRKIILTAGAVLLILIAAGVFWFMRGSEAGESLPAETAAAPAVVPASVTEAAAVPGAVPLPVPQKYIDKPPAVEVVMVTAVTGGWVNPRLLVQLDGAGQWLEAGQHCTRGRVAFVRNMGRGFKLHEISIFDDAGERIKLQGLLVDIPAATGAQGPAGAMGLHQGFLPGTTPPVLGTIPGMAGHK